MLIGMETWRDRLRRVMEMRKIDPPKLAKMAGVSRAVPHQWLSGQTKTMNQNHVFAVADALGVNPRWLIIGKGPMEPKSVEKMDKSWIRNVEPGPDIFSHVPLISWVQAGQWKEIMDIYQPGDGEEMVMVTGRVGPHAFALRVVGDSMYDQNTGRGFPPGALVVVDPDTEAHNGSYVVVRLDDAQEATFKQLVIDGGKQYLKPLNPRYPIIEVNSHATICGVVKRFILEASFD